LLQLDRRELTLHQQPSELGLIETFLS